MSSGGKGGGGTTSQIVGYRYYMAVHMGIGRGPVNEITEIRVGDLSAWTGSITSSQYADIDKPKLFGGDEKEGGIQGTFKVLMGEPTQTVDPEIADRIEGKWPVPGWRGVSTLFYYGLIGSNNPYPKTWKLRVNRTTAGWDGGACWYAEKATITILGEPLTVISFDDNPEEGATLTIGEVTLTFVDTASGTFDVQIGEDTNTTAQNLAEYLNGNAADVYDATAASSETQVQVVFDESVTVTTGDYATVSQQGGTITAMNGAHIIYECATNNVWGRGLPASFLDDTAFRAAADTLYSEKFGLCIRWNRQEDIDKFVQTVLNHIGGALYIDRETGLLTLSLIRGDYDADLLPTYSFDNGIVDITDDELPSSENSYNEIIVKYTSPINGKTGQVRVQDLASFQSLGTLVSTTVEYTGCPTAALALKLAQRDLQMNSADLRRVKVKFNRKGWAISPGSVFKISLPTRGVNSLVLRAGSIEDSIFTEGTITITAVQDVFTLPQVTFVKPQPSYWIPPTRTLRVIANRRMEEMTYYDLAENLPPAELASVTEDTAAIKIFASRPFGAVEYRVTTRAEGETDFVSRSLAGFDETAALGATIGPYDTAITYSNLTESSAIAVGQPILIGQEYARIDAIDLVAETMTIARGCIDTIPASHNGGTTIWFQTNAPTTDFRDYASGESVDVKLVPRNTSDELDSDLVPTDTIAVVARQGRPYPPGDFRINGDPALTFGDLVSDDIVFTWTHRDRITQGNYLLEHGAASSGPESGVTYQIRVYNEDHSTLLRTVSDIADVTWTYTVAMAGEDGNLDSFWFDLQSFRDGISSIQYYSVRVLRTEGFGDNFGFNFGGGVL